MFLTMDPKLLLDNFPNQRSQLENVVVSATWNPRSVCLVVNSRMECGEGSGVMGTGHRL